MILQSRKPADPDLENMENRVRVGGVTLPAAFVHRLRTARELLRSRDAIFREERFATGVAALDARLSGGVERGTLVEMHGARSGGRFSLLLSLIATTSAAGEAVALVDLGDGLDPETLLEAGGDLERVLWLRPRTLRHALAAAEIAITGGFPLVALDLGPPPIAGTTRNDPAWVRLRRAAERHRAAVVVATPFRASGPAATAVLRLATRGWWSAAGATAAPPLLFGLRTTIHVDKERRSTTDGAETVHCALRTAPTALYATDLRVPPATPAAHTERAERPPAARSVTPDTRNRRTHPIEPRRPCPRPGQPVALPPAWIAAALSAQVAPAAGLAPGEIAPPARHPLPA